MESQIVIVRPKEDRSMDTDWKRKEGVSRGLFHYVLYECNSTEVPVYKEIKLIQD